MLQTIFTPANLFIPAGVAPERWSVVACDQYTSEPEYWKRVEQTVGEAPSALRLILPEVYLEQADIGERVERINRTMEDYLAKRIFRQIDERYLYIERTLASGELRRGVIGKLDLEQYCYEADSQSPIRPTEGTVESRLPPRVRVRRNAPLELPHIMVLIDDLAQTVIEPMEQASEGFEQLYNFELMENGGHLCGWAVDQVSAQRIDAALAALFSNAKPENGKAPVLVAVGDGNHSLATAKAFYEQLKKNEPPSVWKNHPARWALVEMGNLHDNSLTFEPIHRVLFGVEKEKLLAALQNCYQLLPGDTGGQSFTLLHDGDRLPLTIQNPPCQLAVGSIQCFLDRYLETEKGTIDYIHGADVVERLVRQNDAIGFLFPIMLKIDIFRTVQLDGALPRKTFSMGHAWDKRYYFEARNIR